MVHNTGYRIDAYLRHIFSAWNTHGEGVHSPYLFYLIDRLLYDHTTAYYDWGKIESIRQQLLQNTRHLEITDYGTGLSGTRRICDIAHSSLEKPQNAQFFYRLVHFLSQQQSHPLEIIELGTSLGITTAYLAMPSSHNHITTYEGDPSIAQLAQHNWEQLGIRNIKQNIGNIDNTLNIYARVDIAYLDANHTMDATLRYYQKLQPHLYDHSIVIVDDIHHSPQMQAAWENLCQQPEVTTSMDCFDYGLLFFDPHYLRKNYKLRI